MSDYGVTSTGFVRKTYEQIRVGLIATLRSSVSPLLRFVAADKIANLVATFSDQAALLWEAAEAIYRGNDPDSCPTDEQFEALCKLTRVVRLRAARGEVLCTINVDAGFSAAAGTLLAYPTGRPGELWQNRSAIASVGGGNLLHQVWESVTVGVTPFVASGTLIVINGAVSGWNSITNEADATAGRDVEPLDELRARRDASLAAGGGSTLPGIIADVGAVTGVIACDGRENTSATFQDIPPHTFEIVIFDGEITPQADDAAVAAALLASRPAGILSVGDTYGPTIDPISGEYVNVPFTRATQVLIWIEATITGTYDADEALAALMAVYPAATAFRQTIVLERLRASLFAVAGVTDVPILQIGVAEGVVGDVNIVPSFGQICLTDSARVTLT